jgi:hypothetical protein
VIDGGRHEDASTQSYLEIETLRKDCSQTVDSYYPQALCETIYPCPQTKAVVTRTSRHEVTVCLSGSQQSLCTLASPRSIASGILHRYWDSGMLVALCSLLPPEDFVELARYVRHSGADLIRCHELHIGFRLVQGKAPVHELPGNAPARPESCSYLSALFDECE